MHNLVDQETTSFGCQVGLYADFHPFKPPWSQWDDLGIYQQREILDYNGLA